MKTPESYEKDSICNWLVSQAAYYFRPYMAGYGKSGVPDIVACLPMTITAEMVGLRMGVFVGVEVKRDGKLPTPLQERTISEIQNSAGFACWGTADRVIPILKALPWAPQA